MCHPQGRGFKVGETQKTEQSLILAAHEATGPGLGSLPRQEHSEPSVCYLTKKPFKMGKLELKNHDTPSQHMAKEVAVKMNHSGTMCFKGDLNPVRLLGTHGIVITCACFTSFGRSFSFSSAQTEKRRKSYAITWRN